jgi:hypothetical protein
MKNCRIGNRDSTELLLAYCASRLSAEKSALLERHLEVCADCRAFRDSQQAAWSALDQWEPQPVSGDFDRRLYTRIEQQGSSWLDRLVHPLRPVFRPAFTLAAACIVVILGFLLEGPRSVAPLPPGSGQASVEGVDAEQVERTLDDLEMLRQLDLVPRTTEANNPTSM